MGKSKVTADMKKNRLLVTLDGVITKADLDTIYTEVRFCVADLKPGFAVINDLTQCRVGPLGGLGTFSRIRDYLCSKEVGTIVRIVRKDQLIFNQISRIIERNSRYRPLYAASQAEAEAKQAERAAAEPRLSPSRLDPPRGSAPALSRALSQTSRP